MIRRSSAKNIDALLADLGSDRQATRDAAVARLAVIGGRAVGRLLVLVRDGRAPSTARSAGFQALDLIGDARTLAAALQAIEDADAEVAAAAAAAAGSFLNGAEAVDALDRLTATALDRGRPSRVRLAAIAAVSTLKSAAVSTAMSTLASDPDPAIAAVARPARAASPVGGALVLEAAAAGRLPDAAAGLRGAIARHGRTAPITRLSQIIEHVRAREQTASASQRGEWTAVRAAVHAVLAQRGSRLALYDLRETLASANGPVAVEFLTAMSDIGDVSCLEPIAVAYTAALAKTRPDDWWRRHLIESFRAIVARERLTKRHSAVKRLWTRWARAANELWVILFVLLLASTAYAENANPCVPPPLVQGGTTGPESAATATLTVASLNMYGQDRIADALSVWADMRSADILFLQEVGQPTAGGDAFVARMSERLQAAFVYAPNIPLKDGSTQGLAILSRFPLHDVRVQPLDYHRLRFRWRCRIALFATVDTAAGPVRIVNVHLDTRINTRAREAQLRPVIEATQAFDGPRIIGGDLNTMNVGWVSSMWPFPYAQRQAAAVRSLFLSAGYVTPFTGTRITYPFFAFPSRLDWLFMSGLQTIERDVDDVQYSDHRGVWARFAWPGGQR